MFLPQKCNHSAREVALCIFFAFRPSPSKFNPRGTRRGFSHAWTLQPIRRKKVVLWFSTLTCQTSDQFQHIFRYSHEMFQPVLTCCIELLVGSAVPLHIFSPFVIELWAHAGRCSPNPGCRNQPTTGWMCTDVSWDDVAASENRVDWRGDGGGLCPDGGGRIRVEIKCSEAGSHKEQVQKSQSYHDKDIFIYVYIQYFHILKIIELIWIIQTGERKFTVAVTPHSNVGVTHS